MDATDFDPSSPDLVAGERLGVWRLQRPLGTVPSGTWWRAGHAMGDQAALVLVYADRRDAGAVLLRMADAEGQRWQHPDLAWPLDSGLTADGRPYVVMPLMDGEPLACAVKGASLRLRLDWALQLCELLLLAQSQGMALVELDPSLLWVGPQQQLRLHGLALVAHDGTAMRLGSLQGQVSLAAQKLQCPASLRGAPGGAQAQVYSVGTLMCWLVNGRYPQDSSPNAEATVQVLSQWVSLPPAARAALDGLLCTAVNENPAERPAGLDVLGQAIAAWLDRAGAADAAPGGPGAESPATASPLAAAAPLEGLTRRGGPPASLEDGAVADPSRPSPWRGRILLLGVLLAVATVMVLTWRL